MGIDTAELEEASERYSEQVSEAVESDDETAAYVEELEERAELLDDEQQLPSGDFLCSGEPTGSCGTVNVATAGPSARASEQP